MVMMNKPDTSATRPLAQVKDHQLQRCRIILLIMLGICLGSCLTNLYIQIVSYTGYLRTNAIPTVPIAATVYYGFGLLVSYRYSTIGLYVVCNVI
ncbi:unnamed protein product [Adineta steineri]|uniref:Uncharacterized protein n=2 Tax=Adineta steineri TaxID=433720 RepID=A0A819YR19_9BILA|nr:unnamed protein product [Adineta steineri]